MENLKVYKEGRDTSVTIMKSSLLRIFPLLLLLLLAGCESNQTIVNSIDEREANEIVVYLASKGIEAMKVQAVSSAVGAETTSNQFNIVVDKDDEVEAMAILNKVGLPRREGTTLLELFAKSGFMSSDREETIRYQAGLAEELKNTIRKIDGVIDADVQLSFPPAETTATPGAVKPKTTAAVYVKHQGVLDDPNSHLEIKIKRLLSGSVNGLEYDNVAVISDRSRLTDITLAPGGEAIGPRSLQQTYVSIWGIVMSKGSLMRFRFIFFLFTLFLIGAVGLIGWMVYRFYPQMKSSFFKRGSSETSQPPPEL